MKNTLNNPTHNYTHLQFTQAFTQPKIAKEYSFSLQKEKRLTVNVKI